MNVSVAMATYMGAAYVSAQLRSVLDQTVPPAEIVVCDDRSSDDTARIVLEVAARSAVPIRLLVNDERLGWRENFMRAATLCTSELIAFCDQDDIWDPRKVESIVAAFTSTGALMVFHDATIVGPDLAPIRPFEQGGDEPDRAGALERGPWRDVYGFTIAFRRELLALWSYWLTSVDKSVGHQRAAHDQWLLFLGSALGTTVHLRDPLALYRQHDNNAVGVKDAFSRTSRIDGFLQYRDVVNLRLVVLDGRIRALDDIARRSDLFGPAATRASVVHRAHRDRVRLQTEVYNSGDVRTRLRALAALLSSRSYASGPWTFGPPQLLDDVAATLLGPTVVARLRRLDRGRRRSEPHPRSVPLRIPGRRANKGDAGRQSQSP